MLTFSVTVDTQQSNPSFLSGTGMMASPTTKVVMRTVQLRIPEITPIRPGMMLHVLIASNGFVKWHQGLQINLKKNPRK